MMGHQCVRFLGLITFGVITVSMASLPALKLSINMSSYAMPLSICGLLLLVTLLYRKRDPRIAAAALATFWGIFFTNAHLLPMFVVARLAPSYTTDAILAAADRSIGIEAVTITSLVRQYPALERSLILIYNSLLLLLTGAVMLPSLHAHTEHTERFFYALAIATAMGFTLFFFFPAHGPTVYYNYKASPDIQTFVAAYATLRSGNPYSIDTRFTAGLICFPSFHTILAILAAYALNPIPYAKVISRLACGLIILATIACGGHYLVDIVGGIIIAALSLRLSHPLRHRLHASPSGSPEAAPPDEHEQTSNPTSQSFF